MKPVSVLLLMCTILCGCGVAATVTPPPTVTPTLPTNTPAPLERIFGVVTDRSIINYEATLQIGNAKIGGTFAVKGDTLKAVPASPGGYQLTVDVILDGTTITGANDLVVNALKSNLEVDKYPTGHFVGMTQTPVTLLPDSSTETLVVGTLELHGVSRPISIPITLTFKDGVIGAKGTTAIDLTDFKVVVPTAILKSTIDFSVQITARENR